ncbi:FecR domain-containing protein [Luteimonas sp. BDR2-5]|uniref:FecR family protein n=1 Tax=Proluteimonas luteida TaxID=2878685 RepID=UPI001E5E4F5C|nr:FecR domain-containing protein [Luteimonas sp. BDR2-5]MCD9026718.1 FecR domain-containing protein [Luteimonas sp. BDR2-5]
MSTDHETARIARQASRYFAGRHRETIAQRRQREAWLAQDERHAHEYTRMERLWERLGDVPEFQAMRERDMALLQGAPWYRRGWPLAAAAALGLLFGGVFMVAWLTAPEPLTYATEFGERRTQTLPDGTALVLNTGTELTVRYSRRHRHVELRQGEAQFTVAHDAKRPFAVRVADSTVTALGTRFQVRRDAEAASVTLLEGSVAIEHRQERHTLQPNEQAWLAVGAGIVVRPIDPERANGWLDGWLRFRSTPLGEIVAEANRFSARKLRLADPALADVQLSGNFRAGDSASIAAAVELIQPVRVDDSGTDIVLVPR